jgi:hypothetical protein
LRLKYSMSSQAVKYFLTPADREVGDGVCLGGLDLTGQELHLEGAKGRSSPVGGDPGRQFDYQYFCRRPRDPLL